MFCSKVAYLFSPISQLFGNFHGAVVLRRFVKFPATRQPMVEFRRVVEASNHVPCELLD